MRSTRSWPTDLWPVAPAIALVTVLLLALFLRAGYKDTEEQENGKGRTEGA